MGKVESEKKSVKRGVPQGSILRPMFFIIYLKDVPTPKSKEITTVIYADDTVVSNNGSIETVGKNTMSH